VSIGSRDGEPVRTPKRRIAARMKRGLCVFVGRLLGTVVIQEMGKQRKADLTHQEVDETTVGKSARVTL